MPELPEVETVRRGLQPAMAAAASATVEVRHRGLPWPSAKDFDNRLTGPTVQGPGRRPKYPPAYRPSGAVRVIGGGILVGS